MAFSGKLDLHMHSTVSDGSDTPAEILAHVREAGIELFALSDHDAVKGCLMMRDILADGDPGFICGAEFSCKDSLGKYHILGYGYDPDGEEIHALVDYGHSLRMRKVTDRLDFLRREFGFEFPEEEIAALLALDNPGKPHIGNLMAKLGYVESKDVAINDYINKLHVKNLYVSPEEAIEGILRAGGIPVLAHPFFGSGGELVLGDDMDARLRRLMDFGLRGVEAYYSGFSPKLTREMLAFAEKYSLYVTAGSDYHGSNKLVHLGDTNMNADTPFPAGMTRFLEDVRYIKPVT
jgi:hypothetical protein